MDQNLESKLELKDRLINLYKHNKIKLLILIFFFIIILTSIIYIKYDKEQKNILIAEKYVLAGLHLASNKKDKATPLYEEIILSNNEFYSVLALNTIIEKKLISNKNKILEYFDILEKSTSEREKIDLIIFKKSLYLIKNSDVQKGKNLMRILIDNNSNLKPIAQEILGK